MAKEKAFRWLGVHGPTENQGRKGVLHITTIDRTKPPGDPSAVTRRVVQVGDIVRDPAELEALGSARIEELVRFGNAEPLDLLDKLGVEELLGRGAVESDSSDDDKIAAQRACDDAVAAGAQRQVMERLTVSAAAAGDPSARSAMAPVAPNAIGGVHFKDLMKPVAPPATEPAPAPPATPPIGGSGEHMGSEARARARRG